MRSIGHIRSIFNAEKNSTPHKSVVKSDGDLGVRDFKQMDEAATIKIVVKVWGNGEVPWVRWMNSRCVKGRSMVEIKKKAIDSADWKAALAVKNKIARCARLSGVITWSRWAKGRRQC